MKKRRSGVFLHTAIGTKLVTLINLRCQHKLNNKKYGTIVNINYYVNNKQQHYFTHQPKYFLVGKSHLVEFHYAKQFAVAQMLHGNGTHLLAMQAKICNQHPLTKDITSKLEGTRKISPSLSPDTISNVIKLWHITRYLGTHNPKPPSSFPVSWSIEEIINHLQAHLTKFTLRDHAPASNYSCRNNTFIMDGTQKITFKVCQADNCFEPVKFKTAFCNSHASYHDNYTEAYTGIYFNCNVII